MIDYGWLSLVPPVTAIVLALWTRQVYLALYTGILIGTTILAGFNPIAGAAGSIDKIIAVVTNRGNAEVLLFTLVVGALIVMMRESGGVNGFANFMVSRGWVRGPVSAQLLSIVVGTSIFIESNITCLITGAVSRPLYDRVKLSRAKLAYMCDSTSAPICILIPLNAWGAYVLTLLAAEGLDPLPTLIAAVPLNFYAVLAIVIVVVVAVTGWNIGPMKVSEQRALAGDNGALPEQEVSLSDYTDEHRAAGKEIPERAVNLIAPVLTTIVMMIVGLWVTGAGVNDAGVARSFFERVLAGSGSLSVLWAVSSGVAVAMVLAKAQGFFTFPQMAELVIIGFRELVGVAAILALALAIGAVCRELGTGPWVAATVSPWINAVTAAPLVFIAAAFIAFSTGTSWGTWAIMFPIAMPVASALDASVPLMAAAVLGGGVFGDHCSPISDTTVVSSLSAGVDHIEHVVTQIPYALVGGAAATVLYFVAGLVIG
jgi:Na+/H+ antiporter NhaC